MIAANSVEVIKSHRTSTERQIWEALQIQGGDHDELINNKSEWGMNCLVRQETAYDREVVIDRGGEEVNSDRMPFPDRTSREVTQSSSNFNTQFRQRQKLARTEKTGQGQSKQGTVRSSTNLPPLLDQESSGTAGKSKKRKM